MSSQTVLVVEDETSFVEALTLGLRREGFRVEVAVGSALRVRALTRVQGAVRRRLVIEAVEA